MSTWQELRELFRAHPIVVSLVLGPFVPFAVAAFVAGVFWGIVAAFFVAGCHVGE